MPAQSSTARASTGPTIPGLSSARQSRLVKPTQTAMGINLIEAFVGLVSWLLVLLRAHVCRLTMRVGLRVLLHGSSSKCVSRKFYYLFPIVMEIGKRIVQYKRAKSLIYPKRQNKRLLISKSGLQYLVNDVDHQEYKEFHAIDLPSDQTLLGEDKAEHNASWYVPDLHAEEKNAPLATLYVTYCRFEIHFYPLSKPDQRVIQYRVHLAGFTKEKVNNDIKRRQHNKLSRTTSPSYLEHWQLC
ncbi:hypothetical protein DBV15_11403 [Temnothorax longispinosus]|uniref:Uncharacterized protein n=1 Tax=Temnothorax longispinosus TaxID=300112 RepID=A0A4S2KUI2_9HYME|nr:hypothetical protein DBV15_11403 [Temnothorax longispinosus]